MLQPDLTHALADGETVTLECGGEYLPIRMHIRDGAGMDVKMPLGSFVVQRLTVGRDADGVIFGFDLVGPAGVGPAGAFMGLLS